MMFPCHNRTATVEKYGVRHTGIAPDSIYRTLSRIDFLKGAHSSMPVIFSRCSCPMLYFTSQSVQTPGADRDLRVMVVQSCQNGFGGTCAQAVPSNARGVDVSLVWAWFSLPCRLLLLRPVPNTECVLQDMCTIMFLD